MISSKSECSRNGELLPGAMIAENRINRFFSVLLPVLFFVLLFVWWLTPERELFRVEGLYAASAQEYRPGINVTAHAVVQRNVLPLYPAVTSLLHKCGIPMESSLRIVSVFMLGAWAVLAAFIAGKRRNFPSWNRFWNCRWIFSWNGQKQVWRHWKKRNIRNRSIRRAACSSPVR